jgi:hypothetical protein
LEKIVRPQFDVLHERITMHRLTHKRPKNHHLQCSSK